jgi:hypothetical protein
MYQFQVTLTYATHYVFADDYSVSGGRYIFWIKQRSVRSFPITDVVSVERISPETEKPK